MVTNGKKTEGLFYFIIQVSTPRVLADFLAGVLIGRPRRLPREPITALCHGALIIDTWPMGG